MVVNPAFFRPKDEPLGIALLVASALHALLILGVGFDILRGDPPMPQRSIDITLTPPPEKKEKPDNPDFLAQHSRKGGTPEEGNARPTSPPALPTPRPKPQPKPQQEATGQAGPKPKLIEKQVVATQKAPNKVVVKRDKTPVQTRERPDIARLLSSTQLEIDRLTAELEERARNAAKQPRRKAINASTQEYKYAAYLNNWRKKVERIGNLNYPDEAKRKKLYGNLLLHVAVRWDGQIESIRVVKSSGFQILDDAAVRIVKLSAPFAPFPADIKKEIDVLDITRTWQFLNGQQLIRD